MWKIVENSNEIKPDEIDEQSSNEYVYIRKDFEEVDSLDQDNNKIGTHWRYKENLVLKKDWELYKSLLSAKDDITETQLAICELYEMIQNGGN